MICPVNMYEPNAATKPIIAKRPLVSSAMCHWSCEWSCSWQSALCDIIRGGVSIGKMFCLPYSVVIMSSCWVVQYGEDDTIRVAGCTLS